MHYDILFLLTKNINRTEAHRVDVASRIMS